MVTGSTRNAALIAALVAAPALASAAAPRARDGPVAAAGGAHQSLPALAYDARRGRYLVTWTDFRNRADTRLDVYGRFVAREGMPVGDDVALSRVPRGQAFSAVAFDPDGERFLVVWTDWREAVAVDSDIYGQLVGADGTLLGDNFVVASGRFSQKYPALAFASAGRRFLVLWSDNRSGPGVIRGRFVDESGAPVGEEFPVGRGGGDRDRPCLAWDPLRERFLVIWRDLARSAIEGALLDGQGTALGPGLRIADEPSPFGMPPPALSCVAAAPPAGRFLVAWTARGGDTSLDVRARLLDPDGTPIGADLAVAGNAGIQEAPAVAFDARSRRFLVVWQDNRRGGGRQPGIDARFVTADGALGVPLRLSDPVAGAKSSPAIAYGSEAPLVVWEDARERPTVTEIYGRLGPRDR